VHLGIPGDMLRAADTLRRMRRRSMPIQPAAPAPGLSPLELAQDLLSRIERGNDYARMKKSRFRRSSTVLHLISLTLLVASTIILGRRAHCRFRRGLSRE